MTGNHRAGTSIVAHHRAGRTLNVTEHIVDGARSGYRRVPGLYFHQTAVAVRCSMRQYLNLAGRNRRENELAPDLVVPAHIAISNIRPGRGIPVLHVESCEIAESKA